ncbi:MAG: Sec23/Sec24 zinc finger-containing protein [Lachnospiraceae bacterium]|nr:Sec23/Sec24 zinc finger-containing protein [Lachnospiraceae bacterium]
MFKDILWFCDDCGAFLNKQMGFTDTKGTWTCLDCGYVNEISESMIER